MRQNYVFFVRRSITEELFAGFSLEFPEILLILPDEIGRTLSNGRVPNAKINSKTT